MELPIFTNIGREHGSDVYNSPNIARSITIVCGDGVRRADNAVPNNYQSGIKLHV